MLNEDLGWTKSRAYPGIPSVRLKHTLDGTPALYTCRHYSDSE